MEKMDIGQEIIILRAKHGWTQQQFAQKLNTTQRTVAAWESGESVPRKTLKVRIAQVFGLPDHHFLLEEADEQYKEPGDDNSENVDKFEETLLRNLLGLSAEKKAKLRKAFQDIMEATEEK